MAQLNNDVLTLVIDNVVDGHTLFSLLTVSQQAFRLACRSLYRDPAFFILQMDEITGTSTVAFIQFVLSISPIQDDDTNFLKQAFNVKPTQSTPMLDYFSLIRVIRWEEVIDEWIVARAPTLAGKWSQPYERGRRRFNSVSYARHHLTRSLCFHQLENIVELEIQSKAIEEYVHMAPRLSHLTRITINNSPWEIENVCPLAIRLVKAIRLHHGRDLLQECRFKHDCCGFMQPDKWLSMILELESLLPTPKVLKDQAIEPLQPIDQYLAREREMLVSVPRGYKWAAIVSHYRDLPAGRILQRCRSLTSLELEDEDYLVPYDGLFEWAAQEALDRASGRPVPPTVPLVNLRLDLTALDVRRTRKLVKDALAGFNKSLGSLHIEFRPQIGSLDETTDENSPLRSDCLVDDETQVFPRLQNIYFSSIEPDLFDPRLWMASPNLIDLTVSLRVDSERINPLCQQWPQVRLLNLTVLKLHGCAVIMFDPISLTSMPNLDRVELTLLLQDIPRDSMAWMERWTWDWHLPCLTFLRIDCDVQGWFSLKILRSCPQLSAFLPHLSGRCTLNARAELNDPCRDIFNQVTFLNIDWWNILPDDVIYLLQQVFPCVTNLHFSSSESAVCQMIRVTYNHPTLKCVNLSPYALSKEKREEIGLDERIDGFRVNDDGNTERGCKYIFDHGTYYIMRQ